MNHAILHGVLTLTSPLHTTDGMNGLRLQRDGRVAHRGDDGIPVVSTVTTPISVRGRFHGDLPIFPANGISGRLRRMAARRMRAALTADKKPIAQSLYYALMNGHAPGQQLGATFTLDDYARVKSDIFFGLFGGGSMRHAASYIQQDLVPVTALTIDAGLVPQKFSDLAPVATASERELEPWQMFDYRVMRKLDDIARGRDTADRVQLQEADEERLEGAVAYQVIPPGTSLYWRTSIDPRATAEQVGLLLLAWRDLCEVQQLGARVHLGWGGFTPQRFRWIAEHQRADIIDARADDEGVVSLVPTADFDKLVAPAVKELARITKKPGAARDALMELLRA